ncbi:MAG: NUDIX hydrolase [Thermoproteota archaeon]|nr:NUDIX hydrolase [Thermoproteota archaeon]
MTESQRHDKHKNPAPAVDFLISKDENSKILLVRRKNDPFKGMLSIPGGFINEGETAENAMIREAKEETSLVVEPIAILGVYSDPQRDPRMHTISVTFITRIVQGSENARDDAAALQWINIEDELNGLIQSQQIAFDHSKILNNYKQWIKAVRGSVDSTNLTFWSTKKEQTEESLKIKPAEE